MPVIELVSTAWKAKYPQGVVLSKNTGYARSYTGTPYGGYEQNLRTMFPVPEYRNELPKKAWVVGVLIQGEAKAYPLRTLPADAAVIDEVGGTAISIQYSPATEEVSVTTAAGGIVPFVKVYWFAWQAFYPDTGIWTR